MRRSGAKQQGGNAAARRARPRPAPRLREGRSVPFRSAPRRPRRCVWGPAGEGRRHRRGTSGRRFGRPGVRCRQLPAWRLRARLFVTLLLAEIKRDPLLLPA